LKCVAVTVEGVLKGLGYLGYVYIAAVELKIKGWARYREDNSVEIIAIGDEEKVEKFLEKLYFHDSLAIVNNIYVNPCPNDISINVDSFELIL
jgi:acylphosphatase